MKGPSPEVQLAGKAGETASGPGFRVWLLCGGHTESGGGEAGGTARPLWGESPRLRVSTGLVMGCGGWGELGLCDEAASLRQG